MRGTQGVSQTYMDKRRRRREVEGIRRRREGLTRGRGRNLASNQFPKCSPQSGTSREVHGVI